MREIWAGRDWLPLIVFGLWLGLLGLGWLLFSTRGD